MYTGSRLRLLSYAITAAAVGLLVPLGNLLIFLRRLPASLFLLSVLVSAWYGLGEGLLATFLSGLALAFFFMPPIGSLQMGFDDAARLAAFVLVGTVTSAVTAVRRRREEQSRVQDQQKTEFLVLLAHELRMPLTAIMHAAESLRCGNSTADATREVVERQGRTMLRLIGDLADVAALGQGQLRLLMAPLDLREVMTQAVDTTRSLFEGKEQVLKVGLPPAPLQLEGDTDRLAQVVVNLLRHASQYTGKGGRIWLSAAHEGDEAVLRVADTGIGFSAEALPHLFDLLVQNRGTRSELGIGLSLVRGLIALHGGTVTAHSAGLGRGCEFVVRLPLPAPDAVP